MSALEHRPRRLARYNGTNEDAQEYGRRARDLYNIFEKYNMVMRNRS
ncbi:hypothetical protein [Streptomyces sp. R41]|uniref:Uncharacterized protein n=1 Tax=Streptomyces sp. R41 TaxID=3238632 RepID=A0AB39RVL2_9ACTN